MSMDLQVAKKFTDRIITIELEFLAARETRAEFLKDIKIEMTKVKHLTPVEVAAVIKAAKDEITPLEKLSVRDEVAELASAIRDTKVVKAPPTVYKAVPVNADQKPLS